MKLLLLSSLLALLAGCAFRPLKPGHAFFVTPDGIVGGFRQSENPQSESKQVYRRHSTDSQGRKVTDEIETQVGAAQKDTAREMAAKLASMRPVMFIGIAVFLFGVVSLWYPPLKVIIASTTTSAAIAAGGLAMVILPTMVVGNEALIFGGVAAAIALWFLAHRHGKTRGELETLRK